MTFLALQGFGGVLAVVQRELVEKKQWMTREEFVEEWAVAQIMPGPNIINLALMIGHRYFGLRGALVAVAGMLACPLVVILVLAVLYSSFGNDVHVANALRGMGAVAAGFDHRDGPEARVRARQASAGHRGRRALRCRHLHRHCDPALAARVGCCSRSAGCRAC